MSFYLSGYSPFALTKFRFAEVQTKCLKFPLRKTVEVVVELVKCIFSILSLIPTLVLDLIVTTTALLGQTSKMKTDDVTQKKSSFCPSPNKLSEKHSSLKSEIDPLKTKELPKATPNDLIDFQKAIKVAFILLKKDPDKASSYSELIKYDGVSESDSKNLASIDIFTWAISCFIIHYLRNLYTFPQNQTYLSTYPGIKELEPIYKSFTMNERNMVILTITAPESPIPLTEAQKVFTNMVNAQANRMTQDRLNFMKQIYWPSKESLLLMLDTEPSN